MQLRELRGDRTIVAFAPLGSRSLLAIGGHEQGAAPGTHITPNDLRSSAAAVPLPFAAEVDERPRALRTLLEGHCDIVKACGDG